MYAVSCLERLRTINSEFDISSDIRGEFDLILSHYESLLLIVEKHILGFESTNNAHIVYVKEVQNFISKDLFKSNNSEIVSNNLKKLNELFPKILKDSNN